MKNGDILVLVGTWQYRQQALQIILIPNVVLQIYKCILLGAQHRANLALVFSYLFAMTKKDYKKFLPQLRVSRL